MVHVQKRCLERPEQDLACDGSRIEGSHKSWNSIMRSFPSGIAVFTALGHDHVHRRNIRLAKHLRHPTSDQALRTRDFARSTHGSHHIHLTIAVSTLWNSLVSSAGSPSTLRTRPLPRISTHEEHFGLVVSDHSSTFGGLLEIKDEPEDEGEQLLVAAAAQNEASDSLLDPGTGTISYLNIPPSHLSRPMPQPPTTHLVTFPSVSQQSTAPVGTNTLDNLRLQTAGTSMNGPGATSSIGAAGPGTSATSEAHAASLRDGATSLRDSAASISAIGPPVPCAPTAASAVVTANAGAGVAHAAEASTTSNSLATGLGAGVAGASTSSEARAPTGASAVSKGSPTKASATGKERAIGTNPLSNSGTAPDGASAAAGTSAAIVVSHHSCPIAMLYLLTPFGEGEFITYPDGSSPLLREHHLRL